MHHSKMPSEEACGEIAPRPNHRYHHLRRPAQPPLPRHSPGKRRRHVLFAALLLPILSASAAAALPTGPLRPRAAAFPASHNVRLSAEPYRRPRAAAAAV